MKNRLFVFYFVDVPCPLLRSRNGISAKEYIVSARVHPNYSRWLKSIIEMLLTDNEIAVSYARNWSLKSYPFKPGWISTGIRGVISNRQC